MKGFGIDDAGDEKKEGRSNRSLQHFKGVQRNRSAYRMGFVRDLGLWEG